MTARSRAGAQGKQGKRKAKAAPPDGAEAHASLVAAAHELVRLEKRLLELEEEMRPSLERVAPEWRDSARNFVHYVALRQHDLRDLQVELSQRGLSSLGRSEGCILASLLEVSARAHEALALRGDESARKELARIEKQRRGALSSEAAKFYLHQHTRELLGPGLATATSTSWSRRRRPRTPNAPGLRRCSAPG